MYNLTPGTILLAEKTREFKLSNFFPFAIRLITGNKVTHVAIVESCDQLTITYWDANSRIGVKRHSIPNVESLNEGGLVLDNETVVCNVANLPLEPFQVNTIIEVLKKVEGSKYNYFSIWTLMKEHFLRHFYTITRVKPDTFYGNRFTCSQLVAYILIKAGMVFSHTFPFVDNPTMVEPDNYTERPFEVTPISELKIS